MTQPCRVCGEKEALLFCWNNTQLKHWQTKDWVYACEDCSQGFYRIQLMLVSGTQKRLF